MATIGFAAIETSEGVYQYCRLFDATDAKAPEPLVPGRAYDNLGEAASCPEALKIIRRESVVFEFAIAAMAEAFVTELGTVGAAISGFAPETAGNDTDKFETIQNKMIQMTATGQELLALLEG